MTGKGCWVPDGREGGLVILSEGRKLRSVGGVCAMILDSSLRCAAFRMTGGGMAAFGMTGEGAVQNDRGRRAVFGVAEIGQCHFECREESEVCGWWVCDEFRFLTVFGMTEGGMAAFGMTGGRGRCAQNGKG